MLLRRNILKGAPTVPLGYGTRGPIMAQNRHEMTGWGDQCHWQRGLTLSEIYSPNCCVCELYVEKTTHVRLDLCGSFHEVAALHTGALVKRVISMTRAQKFVQLRSQEAAWHKTNGRI
jgi:hypothetical protein